LKLVELDHPVARDLLTRMRDRRTPPAGFRVCAAGLSTLLAFEASRHLQTAPVEVETPMESTLGELLARQPVIVAILRAGLGMLGPFQAVLPLAPVGFVAVRRDEQTSKPIWFYDSVPDATGRQAIILDPMLATGGTSRGVVDFLFSKGAAAVVLASMVSAPEGIAKLSRHERLIVVTAAVDRDLDSRWFIRPGLGDCGDRLYSETGRGPAAPEP